MMNYYHLSTERGPWETLHFYLPACILELNPVYKNSITNSYKLPGELTSSPLAGLEAKAGVYFQITIITQDARGDTGINSSVYLNQAITLFIYFLHWQIPLIYILHLSQIKTVINTNS